MHIFRRDAIHVGSRYLLDFHEILVEPIGGVSVEFISDALGQNFVGGVEAEDKRVQDGVLGLLDLIVGDGLLSQVVDVLIEGLD